MLPTIKFRMNENGKIFVYKAEFLVAIADGEIAKEEELKYQSR